MDAHSAVEQVARDSYGRLLAFVATRARDVAAAEDALADAFRAALETWPRDGVPPRPEGWLVTTARRKLIDEARKERVREDAAPSLWRATELAAEAAESADDFPDDRLRMLFLCAHPAIDAAMRTPLMLQAVLGLDAARIGSAFLVAPATMGQRLVRAKAKIRDARLSFELPAEPDLAERLEFVLDAIYAAYGTGWEDAGGTDARYKGLADEALYLARVLVRLLPAAAEARGLLALVLYCESRRPARRTPRGEYVPLTEQDVSRWSAAMIGEAERELVAASRERTPGRFQLEAAIQSVHAARLVTGAIDWPAIAALYGELVRLAPTIGALVGQAAAIEQAYGAEAGLAALGAVDEQSARSYQPYWAVRAHLLARLGRPHDARGAYSLAIGLCEDPETRRFLIERAAALDGETAPS